MNKKFLFTIMLSIFIFHACREKDEIQLIETQYNLELDTYVEREITNNQTDTYTLNIKSESFFVAELDQKGVDLKFRLDSLETNLLEIDSIRATQGKEGFCYVFEPGTYKLSIRSPIRREAKGKYRLFTRLESLNNISIKEFNVQKSLFDAEKMRNSGEEELIERSEKTYLESLDYYTSTNNKEKQLEILVSLGSIQFEKDNKEKALSFYREALLIAESLNDLYWFGKILNGMGDIYFVEREIEVAKTFFQRALEKKRICGDVSGEAESINNLGSVEWYLGENQKALDLYNQSLKLVQLTNDKVMEGIIHHNLGSVYDLLGEYETAIYHYQLGLELQKGVPFGEVHALIMLARAYNSLGNTNEALKNYDEALIIANNLKNNLVKTTALQHMAAIFTNLNNNEKAKEYYTKSIALSEKSGDITAKSIAYAGLAKLDHIEEGYDAALKKYDIALTLIQKVKDIETELNIIYGIAATEYKMGNFKKAEGNIKKAIEIIENNRVKFDTPEIKSAYFATKNDYYSLYISLLMNYFQKTKNIKYSEKALEINEKWHARSLLDVLGESQITNHNVSSKEDKSLILKKDTLQKLLRSKIEKEIEVISAGYSEEELSKYKNEIIKLKNDLISVESEIRKNKSPLGQYKNSKPLTAQDIRNLVSDKTLILSYHIGKENSYVWGITSKSMQAISLGNSAEITSLSKKIHIALAARATWLDFEDDEVRNQRIAQADKEYLGLLYRMTKIILTPLSNLFRECNKIVIVTDGNLNYVPFGALNSPDSLQNLGNYAPLITTHEIITIPSVSSVFMMRQQPNRQTKDIVSVAAFADPIFTSDDPRIEKIQKSLNEKPMEETLAYSNVQRVIGKMSVFRGNELTRLNWTRNEVMELKKLSPNSKVWLDSKATLSELMKVSSYDFDILHLASHGVFNLVHPELSGIILSLLDKNGNKIPGFLNSKDVANLKAPEIVVLSACSTALGKDVPGEGVAGLAQAFICAGAKKVVTTLWNINDQATSELMKEFYTNLLIKKMSVSESLRQAQLHMFQTQQYKHPYYWSAFTVQGEFD